MCFFCFKQKTAYEMRISDWSSDVCSSDLIGDAAIAIPFDAGEPDTIASMVAQTAEHFGRIDVLHNNAALLDLAFLERDRTAVDTDIEVWDRTMEVNVRGYMVACKHVTPYMRRQGGGSIINTSSNAAEIGRAHV